MNLLITTLTFMFISFTSYSDGKDVFNNKDCKVLRIETKKTWKTIFNYNKEAVENAQMYTSEAIKVVDYHYKQIDTYTKIYNTFCKD